MFVAGFDFCADSVCLGLWLFAAVRVCGFVGFLWRVRLVVWLVLRRGWHCGVCVACCFFVALFGGLLDCSGLFV